eukprot:3268243-Pleurochrysis_carterae.AAC.2
MALRVIALYNADANSVYKVQFEFHSERHCRRSQTGSICDVAWQLDCFVRLAANAADNDVLVFHRRAGNLAAAVLNAAAERRLWHRRGRERYGLYDVFG